MRVHLFEWSGVRLCGAVLLLSLTAPLPAAANGGSMERGALDGDSFAGVIRNAGSLVGWGHGNARAGHGVSWNGLATMRTGDLLHASLVRAGRQSEMSTGIYDRGWKIGDARNTSGATPPPFALGVASPAPEPESWAMMLLGLVGVVGALMLRRRSDAA